MIPGRRNLSQLEPAQRALAEGRYEAAFALLEDAARRPLGPAARALYQLHLAAADALYGDEGVDGGLRALRAAAEADPQLVGTPLYRALHWEFRAVLGAPEGDVRRGLAGFAPHDDPLAAYHAASALWRAGAVRRARRVLEAVPATELPAYLRWRRAALLGHVLEEAAAWEAAAHAYAEAFAGATGPERESVRIHLAGTLLEMGRTADLLILLSDLDETLVEETDLAWARQLQGRAELELDNPGRALALLEEAERLAEDAASRFGAVYAASHALVALGRHDDAADRLARVLPEAPGPDRPYALHERAVALLEADRPEEAEGCLDELLLDPDYPHRAEATADLAEVRLRLGDLAGARDVALRALDLGATAPACLTLGTVAFEYFDLEDAVTWLERAVGATVAGDPAWCAAQQLLADVFAQRGEAWAERLLVHAKAALAHTEPGSDWERPLQDHVRRARRLLGGHDRLLN